MLHIIDIEKKACDSITRLAMARMIDATVYESGGDFLSVIHERRTPDSSGECVLLDLRISTWNVSAVFDALTLRDLMRRFPVIFMIRHGDIRLLSEGMKRDAFDFVEKPFDAEKLMDRVDDALAASRHMNASKMIHSRLAVLSAREKEVLGLILDGYMNKVIGEKLGISRRTVEAHRANIFHKINVKNAMELARFLR